MPSKPIYLVTTDGTGPSATDRYLETMQGSFCSQIGAQMPNAPYHRGPTWLGGEVTITAQRATEEALRASSSSTIMLAGYSRGGSIAIMVAEALMERGLPVEAMFLFDPVARHAQFGGRVIPPNVKRVYAVRRSLTTPVARQYDGKADGIFNPFYVWFGTTGTSYEGTGAYKSETFVGTHGAMGGFPWATVNGDASASQSVAQFMNNAFAECNVPVKLTPKPPGNYGKPSALASYAQLVPDITKILR